MGIGTDYIAAASQLAHVVEAERARPGASPATLLQPGQSSTGSPFSEPLVALNTTPIYMSWLAWNATDWTQQRAPPMRHARARCGAPWQATTDSLNGAAAPRAWSGQPRVVGLIFSRQRLWVGLHVGDEAERERADGVSRHVSAGTERDRASLPGPPPRHPAGVGGARSIKMLQADCVLVQ